MLRSNEKDRDGEHASWTQRVWPERKVMYPVQMWHEYFRITGSRSSKNRPVQILFRGSIPSSSSRDLFHRRRNVFRFASDRKTERKLNRIFFPSTCYDDFFSSSYFYFRSFYSIFFRSRWNLDGQHKPTYVRSDLYRDSSPRWNLARIARFHENHSLTHVSIVH